jgi:heme A synthase
LSVGCLRQFLQVPTVAALATTAAVALSVTLLVLLAWPETRQEIHALRLSGKLPGPSASA